MAGVARTAEGLRGCPGFGPFWAAATVSSFGTYVTTLAVQVLVVLTLGGGAAEVGLVSAARWLPYLLFGVFAGVFVDRARRRPILVTTDFVRCVLLVAIPTLAVAHQRNCKRRRSHRFAMRLPRGCTARETGAHGAALEALKEALRSRKRAAEIRHRALNERSAPTWQPESEQWHARTSNACRQRTPTIPDLPTPSPHSLPDRNRAHSHAAGRAGEPLVGKARRRFRSGDGGRVVAAARRHLVEPPAAGALEQEFARRLATADLHDMSEVHVVVVKAVLAPALGHGLSLGGQSRKKPRSARARDSAAMCAGR